MLMLVATSMSVIRSGALCDTCALNHFGQDCALCPTGEGVSTTRHIKWFIWDLVTPQGLYDTASAQSGVQLSMPLLLVRESAPPYPRTKRVWVWPRKLDQGDICSSKGSCDWGNFASGKCMCTGA
jgi:hypothetical protein